MTEIDLDVHGSEGQVSSEAELRRRLSELAAVYRMAEAAVAADTLDDVLDEAVDALVEALAVDRASILLRDQGGRMRFRAWRGLSDEYRAAVDGHSPWTGDEDEFEPIVMADVASAPGLADDLRQTILDEGIAACAFVPLVHGGRLLGKFMLYADSPRGFSQADLRLAQTIASTIANATRRAQAEQALRESQQRLDVILREVADGITVQLPDGTLVFANDAAARLVGYASADELVAAPEEEILGRFELLDEQEGPLGPDELPGRVALSGGRPQERVIGYRVRETGEVRWSIVGSTPVVAPDGRVEFAINVFRDVTERRRQEQRLAFLARAGDALARSLDYSRTLAEVARLAVPTLGDWAMVYIQEPDGRIRRLAVEHFAGRHEGLLEVLEGRYPFDPDAEIGVPAVVRTGKPQLHAHADSHTLAADVVDGERLAAELEGLGIRSWMCVPLTARGRTFGAMSFLATESRRTFDESDLDLAGELARRAASAVDNAKLYEEAQRSFALLDAVLASAPVGIGFWDADIRYVRVNETLAALNGLPPEEHVGKTLWEVIPDLAPVLEPVYRSVVESGQPLLRHEASTDLNASRLGDDRHWLSSYFPVTTRDGETLGVGAVIIEISERKRAEVERDVRARQQADVARLGQLALSGTDLDELMDEAVAQLARTLDVEYAKVLELLPDGSALRLRAGVGWQEGLVGAASVGAGRDSQAGYTLEVGEPVVVEDLPAETRFTGPPLLHEHGVVSGMSVVIQGRDEPFGVLGVHTGRRRGFTEDDVNYLRAVANVLAAAVDQRRLRELERSARERLRFLAEASRILSSSLDYETTLQNVVDLASHTIADWASVTLVDGKSRTRRLIGWHRDPARAEAVTGLVERYPPKTDPSSPIGRVLADGRGILVERVTDEVLAAAAHDDEHLALLRDVGLTSAVIAPIVAAGVPIGALTLALESPGRAFADEDLAQAEEIGRRAGLAIENARLYQAAQEAVTLFEAEAEASIDGLLVVAPDGRILSYNRRFGELWQFSDELLEARSDERALESAVEKVADPEAFLRRVEEIYANPVPSHDEIALLDGRVIERYGAPVRAEDGTYYGYLWSFRDVTEPRRAAAELEKFASLVETSTDFVGMATLDGRGLYLNPAGYELVGLERETVHRTTIGDFCTPETLELFEREAIPTAMGEGSYRGEWSLRHFETGEPIAVEGTIFLVRDPARGEPLVLATVQRDIRERRRAEAEVRYQSELTRTVTDNATSALFMMDERGHPTYMNRAAEEITGFVLDEIRGRPLHDAIHHTRPDGTPYPIEECPIDRALPAQTTVTPYEDVFVRKDGSFFPVRAAASPIYRGGVPVGTVVEVQDITAVKAAERERAELLKRERDARRQAEARAQAAQALEFVGDGVFMLDRRGVVRLWNPAAEAVTGIPADRVVGRAADRAIPGWADLASRVPIVETGGRAAARAETLPLEIEGREVWVSISGVGFPAGTVFAFRDVTEERGLEKLKSDFVSTISHELRTPLAAIYGAALTLARTDMALEQRQRSDLLGVIAAESERLARIVNDILWTSRIESGGLQLTIEAFDAVELVTGVVHAFEVALPPGVRIDVEAEPDLPRVAADPDKVRQVLTNLVENAIKYSPDGGRILVDVSEADARVRLAVADEGLGIPTRELGRIFEKFYRLDPNLTRGVGGTGLGLYICRELIGRMGGRIWVESEEGRGSTFVVELPASDDVAAHAR